MDGTAAMTPAPVKPTIKLPDLEPRRLMGRVSQGMLFDLGSADGLLPALAVPEHPVPDGTRAG